MNGKYRGLTVDTKKWVYGWYIERYDTMSFIINSSPTCDADNMIEVIPETVGQFTGLLDKNGKEIYGGDIIQTVAQDGARLSKFKVYWHWANAGFWKEREDGSCYQFTRQSISCCEIIGDIHSNPNLLNEAEK